jgi:hypothetical protein
MTPIASILYQRHHIVFHASAVIMRNGAVMFAGPSGSGKTTLISLLAREGCRLIADDMCAISFGQPNGFVMRPGPNDIRIYCDTKHILDDTGVFECWPIPHTSKWHYDCTSLFVQHAMPLFKIYFLSAGNESDLSLCTMTSDQIQRALWANTYQRVFAAGFGEKESYLAALRAMSEAVKVERLVIPRNPEALGNAVCKIIAADN